jgi:TetR/AcrR family transcriptional repressor of lmrAB and yxaGH operons
MLVLLADRLEESGWHKGCPVPDVATTVVALIEGALLLARVQQSREPINRVARRITALL